MGVSVASMGGCVSSECVSIAYCVHHKLQVRLVVSSVYMFTSKWVCPYDSIGCVSIVQFSCDSNFSSFSLY